MAVKLGQEQSKFDAMSRYWPSTIREYWKDQEQRKIRLSAKLISESLQLDRCRESRPNVYARRKSYVSPPSIWS